LVARVGLGARPDNDVAGLVAAHRAFVEHVAYDGITAQLSEHRPLDPDALVERTLTTRRGGYCFEINTILLTFLRGLGFAVERREGIVDAREARAGGALTNHLALVATTAGGKRFLCDAGWGEGPLAPVPLHASEHVQGPLRWTLERDGDDGWWITQHAWGSTPGFRFGDEAVPLSTFAPHHLRLSTAPDSNFVKTLVVQQPHEDHVTTLRARTLTHQGPDRDDQRVLNDAAELDRTLRDVFDVHLDAGRIERLWSNACAQHAAYVATRTPPGTSSSSRASAPSSP
jgi:N-hydroxyarylamine O-acetyltransferase